MNRSEQGWYTQQVGMSFSDVNSMTWFPLTASQIRTVLSLPTVANSWPVKYKQNRKLFA